MVDATTITGLDALRGQLNGRLSLPDSANWNEARTAWNLAVDQRPEAVVFPETADEVGATVEFAQTNGLRVNVQGTGHNASPIGPMADTILVRTTRMTGVAMDVDARTARVEAGALWAHVSDPASEHGLVALSGSARDVGVVGYTLGGGLSFLSRTHGLAAGSVTAIELVTADGELIRADASEHPDLFWALRGGGGNFGVVTAMELRLYEAPPLYAGNLAWPWERSADVLNAWHELLPELPDEMTTTAKIVQTPPLPEIPEPIRGRQLVVVLAVFQGSEEAGAELLRPLRDLGPELDMVDMVPPNALGFVNMDPPEPIPYASGHRQLRDGPELIDSMLAAAGPGSGSELILVELRQLGGALQRPNADGGALSSLDADLALFAVGMAGDEAMAAATAEQARKVTEAFAPLDAGNAYLNFTEHESDPARFYDADTFVRLREIKRRYDPTNVVRANHEVPPIE
jgi:FAD binding domain/Berberine and berberine like